jgi:putative SOS response-associated peptidase YedK
MCGRYTLTKTPRELAGRFNVEVVLDHVLPRYNIAPGQMIPVIILEPENSATDSPKRLLVEMKWGLFPFWAKDKKMKPLINARAETLAEKPTFRKALLSKRCLIPADAFYEWKITAEGKVPTRIHLNGESLYAFAGLWDQWTSEDGEVVRTCTIITVPPAQSIIEIHNRMPAILTKEAENIWLSPEVKDPASLLEVLLPYADSELRFHPVSKLVNSATVDSAECAKNLELLPRGSVSE